MKKIIYTISTLAVAGLCLVSCKDFLSREPINKFSAETYFSSEAEMKMYCNGMINSYMPDATETLGGDNYNDLIGTKTSTDFYRADVIWDDTKQTGWSASNWAFLRRCNYLINNISRGAAKVDSVAICNYLGQARFWRAYNYMSKIKTFSDVPWVEQYLQPSDEDILYGTRDDREFVFKKITEDLLYAMENVSEEKDNASCGALTKWVVCTYASRFFLYEASFRKNFPYNPATGQPWKNDQQTVTELYQLAAQAAATVIEEGGYSLVDDWVSLFKSASLPSAEVLWGRSFLSEINGRHSLTRYYNSSTLGQQYSGTKDLVRHFLKADGTPIESNLTNTIDAVSVTKEFIGRDSRLSETVLGPGWKIATITGTVASRCPDFTFCKTGYMLVKWVIPDETHFQNSVDENSLAILRYPEVLLNYAEAMNELGLMDETVWNLTVGAIRKRAGLTSYAMPTTESDKWLADYYCENVTRVPKMLDGSLLKDNPVALEIRRERVTELSLECGLRQDDIYRYGQAELVDRRYNNKGWAGIYLTADEVADGLNFEGTKYYFTPASEGAQNNTTTYPTTPENKAGNMEWFLSNGTDGYLVYTYDLKWEDRMYTRPIPLTATQMNEKLGQNYQW